MHMHVSYAGAAPGRAPCTRRPPSAARSARLSEEGPLSERGLLEARESSVGLLSTRRVLLGGLALLAFSPTGLIGPHDACAAARLKSRASDVPCVLRLVNASGEWVKLYWLNYDGACLGPAASLHERAPRAVAVAVAGQPREWQERASSF